MKKNGFIKYYLIHWNGDVEFAINCTKNIKWLLQYFNRKEWQAIKAICSGSLAILNSKLNEAAKKRRDEKSFSCCNVPRQWIDSEYNDLITNYIDILVTQNFKIMYDWG